MLHSQSLPVFRAGHTALGRRCVVKAAARRQGKRGASSAAGAAEDHAAAQLPLSKLVPVPQPLQPQWDDAPFKLRPYQTESIQHVLAAWSKGKSAQMVMLPTGCGKTVIFAGLARYMAQFYRAPADASDAAASTAASAPATESSSDSTAASSSSAPVSASRPARGKAIVAAVSNSSSSREGGDNDSSDSSSAPATPKRRSRLEELLEGLPEETATTQEAVPSSSSSSDPLASSSAEGQARRRGRPRATQAATEGSGSSSGSSGSRSSGSQRTEALSALSSDSGRDSGSDSDSASSSDSIGKQGGSGRSSPGSRKQKQQQEQVAPPGVMRVLVLAHRMALLQQAEEKFRLMWGSEDLTVSWVKGPRKEFGGQVVLASAATAVNCIPALKACNFSLVVVDEAHHSVAATYKSILAGLGFIEEVPAPQPEDDSSTYSEQQGPFSTPGGSASTRMAVAAAVAEATGLEATTGAAASASAESSGEGWGAVGSGAFDEDEDPERREETVLRVLHDPNRLLLGFTATPYRSKVSESRHLYDIFSLTYAGSIRAMINQGFLSEVRSHKILTQTDLKGAVVGKTGDFTPSKLSPLVNSRSRNRLVLEAYLQHCTAPSTDPGPTPEQWQRHQQLAQLRVQAVEASWQRSGKQGQGKQSAASGGSSSSSSTSSTAQGSSSSTSSRAEEGVLVSAPDTNEEALPESDLSVFTEDAGDEEAGEIEQQNRFWPLLSEDEAAELTRGLSLSGKRPQRKAIVFAADIKHAEAMTSLFNSAGVLASCVHSRMPSELYLMELARFKSGETEVLCNVEVLTEGFDDPSVDAILMARPTRSQGLYTQMLGRGLRIAPGKTDCVVLDFTDKYNQAGKVVDVRVLLDPPTGPFPEGAASKKGPARVDEDAVGGEVDVLEQGIKPKDLSWLRMGSHWVASLFSGGNVWLVQVRDMGPVQRQLLGLEGPEQEQQQVVGAGRRAGAGSEAGLGGDGDDDEAAGDSSGSAVQAEDDRYVILHQVNVKEPNALDWKVAYTPHHTWRGFKELDAFGAALDYIDAFVRMQQARTVQATLASKRAGKQLPKRRYQHINSLMASAAWRTDPASDSQLKLLSSLGIEPPPGLTKGAAGDLISAKLHALAGPEQRTELEAVLKPEDCASLPVPLLEKHATALLGRVAADREWAAAAARDTAFAALLVPMPEKPGRRRRKSSS